MLVSDSQRNWACLFQQSLMRHCVGVPSGPASRYDSHDGKRCSTMALKLGPTEPATRNTNDDCATHSLPRNQSEGSRHNRPINRVFVGRKESLACTRVTQNLYTQKKEEKKKFQFRQASTTHTKRLRTKIAHSMSRYGNNDNVSNAAIVSVSKTFPFRHWRIQQF